MFEKLKNNLRKYWLLIILFVMLLPFVILFFHTYPYSDDFLFGSTLRQQGYFRSVYSSYFLLNGRYAHFIFAYLFNYSLKADTLIVYRLILLLIFLLTLLSFYFFWKEIFRNHRNGLYAFTGFAFIYLYNYPSFAEGFLWLVVVSGYTMGNLFFVCWLMLLNKLKERKLFSLSTCIVLTALLAGFSETYILAIPTIIMFIIINEYILIKNINRIFVLLFFVSIFGSLFALYSPGNAARMSYEFSDAKKLGIFTSALLTLKFSVLLLLKWFNTPLMLVSVLFFPLGFWLKRNVIFFNERKTNPFFAFLLCFILLSESIFPSYLATGNPPFLRSINISYHLFLFSWFYFLQTLIQWYPQFEFRVDKRFIYLLIVTLIFSIKNSDRSNNNFGNAYSEVISGDVYYVKERWDGIIKQLRSSKKKVLIPYSTIRPAILFHGEIDSSNSSEYNLWLSNYYQNEGIMCK
jgi:hypothetical protein